MGGSSPLTPPPKRLPFQCARPTAIFACPPCDPEGVGCSCLHTTAALEPRAPETTFVAATSSPGSFLSLPSPKGVDYSKLNWGANKTAQVAGPAVPQKPTRALESQRSLPQALTRVPLSTCRVTRSHSCQLDYWGTRGIMQLCNLESKGFPPKGGGLGGGLDTVLCVNMKMSPTAAAAVEQQLKECRLL